MSPISTSEMSTDSISILEDVLLADATGNTAVSTANIVFGDEVDILGIEFPTQEHDFTNPWCQVLAPSLSAPLTNWFLAAETWKIHHGPYRSTVGLSAAALKDYLKMMQSWFERWAMTGSNPFIHSRLYSANFPACVQLALATLSIYIHKTSANTEIILQTVEDRSNQLLKENGILLENLGVEESNDDEEEEIGLFEQLARLHALMVYQIIGLFDGDIRSRHVAEKHMAIQDGWADKLLRSAANALSHNSPVLPQVSQYFPGPHTHTQQQWHLWILSESIRRTWHIAVGLSSMYFMLLQGWTLGPGGIMYTNSRGIWDASSAAEWEERCMVRDVAFLQRFESWRLLEEATPADVDEFGKAMLEITCRGAALQKWKEGNVGL
jgi:hypothetical protein